MSNALHNNKTEVEPEREPSTARPYVIGFLLSVVCTLVPYYMVVEKIVTGTTLLATIIGFAMVQLIIQVVFFLHIGREKKPRFNLFFLVSTIGIIFVVVVGSIWIMNHLHYNMAGKDVADKISTDEAVYQVDGQQVGTCPGTGTNHKIELKNNTAHPPHIDAKLCDTLTIINLDDTERTINFGAYEQHETYAGETGHTIRPGRSTVLTLTEPGIHTFHDHIQNEISGGFTVTPR